MEAGREGKVGEVGDVVVCKVDRILGLKPGLSKWASCREGEERAEDVRRPRPSSRYHLFYGLFLGDGYQLSSCFFLFKV